MVKEIINDFEILVSCGIKAHKKTANAGDLATSNLRIAYIERTEKAIGC
jgi:DNA-binding ferritin-like protein